MRKNQKTILLTEKSLKIILNYENNKKVSFNKAVNEIIENYEKSITSKQMKESLKSIENTIKESSSNIENILKEHIIDRTEYIIKQNVE